MLSLDFALPNDGASPPVPIDLSLRTASETTPKYLIPSDGIALSLIFMSRCQSGSSTFTATATRLAVDPSLYLRHRGAMLRRVLVLLTLTAYAPSGPFLRAQPINAYRAFGEYHPVSEDEAVVKRAATTSPNASVRLFQEALPPGIEMHDGTLKVTPGFKHQLLGKYVYSKGEEVSKDALVLEVKKMCATTGANAAIIFFQLVPNEHQDRAQVIEAVLVVLAPDEGTPSPDGTPTASPS